MELPEYLSEGPSLVNVRRKLDRAEQHLDRLEAAVAPYNSGNFYSVGDLKREGEWLVCRLKVKQAPDPEWGLWVGEFLHNTRSALDNLVWQLVLANDATPGCKTSSPSSPNPGARPTRAESARCSLAFAPTIGQSSRNFSRIEDRTSTISPRPP
jgi:hypothetical protein